MKFELGNDRYIEVTEFRNEERVDIREWTKTFSDVLTQRKG